MALEEGAKAARTFVDSLKEQPLSLALVVVIFALLGFVYYQGVTINQERHQELTLLYENRKYVTDALASCIHVNDIEKLLRSKQ